MARSPQEWRELIEDGIKYRERYARSKDWERWWRYYRGDYGEGYQGMAVNMIFAIGRSLVPRVYFRNPRVVVTPLQPGRYLQAKVLERIDNLVIREIGVKQALKAAALDAFLFGTGIVKRGYDSEFGFNPEQSTSEGGAALTDSGERGEERIEYDSNIRPGWPWVKRIHPATFVVPWGTSDLRDAPWCAHMVIRPLEDVKRDPKYSKSAVKDLKPTLVQRPTPYESSKNLYAPQRPATLVQLWEIYDMKTGKIYVIADGHDKFLREDEDVLSDLGFPFYPIIWNPDHDHFWGISDCVNLEPLQLELNEIRTVARAHRRAALLKFLYKKGAFTEDQLQKLLSGDIASIGIGIEVDGDLERSVLPFQPHVPLDFMTAAQEARMDIREISGFSRNQLGEFDRSTRRTATEAAIVEQAANIRVDERRDVLADVLADIVRGINDSLFKFWTEEHVAHIVGPDGAAYWVRFTGGDLRGEYTYRIDPDTALPTTGATRRQEAVELWRALKDDVTATPDGRQFHTFNKVELARHLLLQYEGIDVEAVMNPAPAMPQGGGLMGIQELAARLAGPQMEQMMALIAGGV